MGRHGYIEGYGEDDPWDLIRWRGAVASAIRGKRGQAFLRELADSMDAMEDKRLGCGALVDDNGCACTLGVIADARGTDVERYTDGSIDDCYVREDAEKLFGIAEALAAEIMYLNDDGVCTVETPEQRWRRMRAWVGEQIQEAA